MRKSTNHHKQSPTTGLLIAKGRSKLVNEAQIVNVWDYNFLKELDRISALIDKFNYVSIVSLLKISINVHPLFLILTNAYRTLSSQAHSTYQQRILK